jgi:hypothetical protein
MKKILAISLLVITLFLERKKKNKKRRKNNVNTMETKQ